MKTAKENLLNIVKEKKILFLEGDNGLYNGLDDLERFFKANKIKYKCIFNIQDVKLAKVIKAILATDIVIFQTTWTYQITRDLHKFVSDLKDKKVIIEHYIHEPSWFRKPDVVHDVYVLKTMEQFEEDHGRVWEFYKLHNTKGIWELKNKFDR